jgi:hypothetical protein
MRTTLFGFIALVYTVLSCTNSDFNSASSEPTWVDTTAFPKQPFSKVVLFVLDSAARTTISTASEGTIQDTAKVEYSGGGYTFVSKAGIPKTSEHATYTLDSLQVQALVKQLKQQPCTSDLVADKNCSPTYRHVYVFYNQLQQPIAQVHVCFSCEKAVFLPNVEYMCDFDNKADFTAFKALTNHVSR